MWDRQPDDQEARRLQARVTDLEARLNTVVGILALIRPAATVLSCHGADKARQQAFFGLINEMASRVNAGSSVSYAEFEERVAEFVPAKRGDRKFFECLIEALKLEQPGSKAMLDYLTHTMALFRA